MPRSQREAQKFKYLLFIANDVVFVRMGHYKILILRGDGIGPEVMNACLLVLEAVQDVTPGLNLEYLEGEAGIHCIKRHGTTLPNHTIELFKESDACLKGPITTIEKVNAPPSVTVTLRKLFNLYANVRPCKTYPGIEGATPGVDLIIVRENTEDLYSGIEFQPQPGVTCAVQVITREASERIARFAFELARKRAAKRKVTVVHKANILRLTYGLFRDVCLDIAKQYSDITVEELRVDAMAMQLIKRPAEFDVIVTTNLFGDILSDEAAQLVGGLGVAPAANIGDKYGMFEPVHGSAPKYAGKNIANPTAMILAAKMMLDWLGESCAASRIENAVFNVLKEHKKITPDLGGKAKTNEMAEAIARAVKKINK